MAVLTAGNGRTIDLRQFETPAALDAALAADIAAALESSIAARARASLALSGGKTPLGMIQRLSAHDLAWSRVGVTLVDDRWLPDDHIDSNGGLLSRHLLTGNAASAQWIPLVNTAPTPEIGLAQTNLALDALCWPLDVCVLGMGNDGHTASLFPCAKETPAAMAPDCESRLAAVHPGTAPYARISLTLPGIAQARHLFLHIVGQQKMDVLQAALKAKAKIKADRRRLPIARALDAALGDCRIYWSP